MQYASSGVVPVVAQQAQHNRAHITWFLTIHLPVVPLVASLVILASASEGAQSDMGIKVSAVQKIGMIYVLMCIFHKMHKDKT